MNCACRRVLAAAWCSGISRKIEVLGSGDCRVVLLLETHVSGRKVDRRVLATDIDAERWAHNQCLESARRPDGLPQSGVAHGFSLIPVSGVGVVVGDEMRWDERRLEWDYPLVGSCHSTSQSNKKLTDLPRANCYSHILSLSRSTQEQPRFVHESLRNPLLEDIFHYLDIFLSDLWNKHIHNYPTVRCCTYPPYPLDDLFQFLRNWLINELWNALRDALFGEWSGQLCTISFTSCGSGMLQNSLHSLRTPHWRSLPNFEATAHRQSVKTHFEMRFSETMRKGRKRGRRNIQQRHDQWWNDFSRHTENRQALDSNVWSHVACAARKSARVCVRWGVICTRAVWNTRIRRTSLPCAQWVSWHQTSWSRFRYRNFLFDSPFLISLRHGVHHVHWCSWIDYEFSLLWTFRSGWRHYPCFDRRVNRSFVRILELVIFSPNPMPLYKRIFLGARSPHVIFPRNLARKDYAHEVHIFG